MNRLVGWFAANTVAANLVMALIITAGSLTALNVTQEIFPTFPTDIITVTVPYPGAAPEEVEEGVCVRIEEAVQGVDGLKRITSSSVEGRCAVTIEMLPRTDAQRMLDDVSTQVDAIDTFPIEAEEPIVQEVISRKQVINVAIAGPADERSLKALGERVRDELSSLPEITQVELVSARPYEISLEVSEASLRRHGLTFDELVAAVQRGSVDLPGGSVKTPAGEILVRTSGQAKTGGEFERLVVRTRSDGTRLLLGDVATVIDGFADTDQRARFDGQPTVIVQVYRVGEQGALDVAEAVERYVAEAELRLPASMTMTTWQDQSEMLRSRLDLLLRNGATGLGLVFLVLALFLELRLAFWVTFGIGVSFLGAITLMPPLGVSVNLISLFAFIVVLGIVVDDAIVVGENIYSHQRRGKASVQAAVEGTQEVAIPVVFAVLTTVAAFAPLALVDGRIGKIMGTIPLIVIPCLLFSLVESQLILPAHLSHEAVIKNRMLLWIGERWRRGQQVFAHGLERFVASVYRPQLDLALRWRYLTVSIAIAVLMLTAGLVGGGYVRFVFFPNIESNSVAATLTMPNGVPVEATEAAVAQLEESAFRLDRELEAEFGRPIVRHMLASIGDQPFRSSQSSNGGRLAQSFAGAELGEVHIELIPSEERTITSDEVARRWREMTGPVADALELTYKSSLFDPGDDFAVQLAGPRLADLEAAAESLKRELERVPGVSDISDSFRSGKQEVRLSVLPSAEALGISLGNLAQQVRQGFYGAEAQRVQRGRDDVKVMVRYPEAERRSLGDVENMRVRLAGVGDGVPLGSVARAELGVGYSTIKRAGRQRTIDVTADVDDAEADANQIIAMFESDVLPDLIARYDGMSYRLEGQQREQSETVGGLKRGAVFAAIVIYALLAIPFRSYVQPLMVMSAIPFGLIGAILGHVAMGLNLTILSMFGIVALTGVVVNDNLVLVDFINRRRDSGEPILQAIRDAGAQRFRPILLTSLTTFAGLTPLLLERSVQAQFLVPMAVSLGFGVLFATAISLLLVPCLYAIVEDGRRVFDRFEL